MTHFSNQSNQMKIQTSERSKRMTGASIHYYNDFLDGASDDEVKQIRIDANIDKMEKFAKELGFESLYDVILHKAKQDSGICTFVEKGGIAKLYEQYKRYRKRRTNMDPTQVRQNLCIPAIDIYKKEWKALCDKDSKDLKFPLNQFSPDRIESFSFTAIHDKIKILAPCLFNLFETLSEPLHGPSPINPKKISKRKRAQQRTITLAISILAKQTTQHFNAVQGPMGFFLFGSKVSKEVISVLNKWGVCPSYNSILAMLKVNAKLMLERLHKICLPGEAIWVSYDNLTFLSRVRDIRLFNQGKLVVFTSGYAVESHPSKSHKMFTHEDCDYTKAKLIILQDLLPSEQTRQVMISAAKFAIWNCLKKFVEANEKSLPSLNYSMPVIFQLDPKASPTIHSLPTYKYNEGKISEMVKIIDNVTKDIGLSEKQIKENVVLFKGDLATVQQNRRAKFRRSPGSPQKRFDFIETSFGLFHLQIHVVVMLFDTYLGKEDDLFFLLTWIKELGRDARRMWDEAHHHVKMFRTCQELIDHVLDGYIIAALSNHFGCESVDDFLNRFSEMSSEELSSAINTLAERTSEYSTVSRQRKLPEKRRDMEHENFILFMQHALVLRHFVHAMRHGDSGLVLECLTYFTIWFQATKKYNYASETIHLTACIKKIWSSEFLQYWKENCLINPTGKKEGWMACDYFGEYVVREIKAMMHHNVNEKTDNFLRTVVSPLILSFRKMRKLMSTECDVPYSSMHSTSVKAHKDIELIAQEVLRGKLCQHVNGRDGPEARDLHGMGLKELSTCKRIEEYVHKIEKDCGYSREEWEQNHIQTEEEIEDVIEEMGWLDGNAREMDGIRLVCSS